MITTKKIVIATAGTMGDIEPFAALGVGLRSRGYAVSVSSNELHRGYFERRGFEFVGGAVSLTETELGRLVADVSAIRHPLKQFRAFAERFFLADARGQLERQLRAMTGADLVVCHWLDVVAQGAADRLGLPWVAGILLPTLIPSATMPPFPFPNLGPRSVAMWWSLAASMVAPTKALYDRTSDQLGLPRRLGNGLGPISPHLNLVAVSPHLADIPPDWPPHVHATGTWSPVRDSSEKEMGVDPRLEDFLARNEPPVVISFGSLGAVGLESTGRLVAETSAALGRPVVFVSASKVPGLVENRRLYVGGFVPYEILFPRACAVVHHAGLGTCVLALRAGAPSVPVPHLFDNGFWATILHMKGVGTRPVLRHKLTSGKLTHLIDEASRSEVMRGRARALGEKLERERGVERAVEHIERLLSMR